MEFEWDEAKNEANMAKHGIDFDDAIKIFIGRVLERVDNRRDYGETRMRAIGISDGRELVLNWFQGENYIRLNLWRTQSM